MPATDPPTAVDSLSTMEGRARSLTGGAGRRRPFFIEFAGTPRAGKTTALEALARFLRYRDWRVQVLAEKAGSCPLENKLEATFNVWTACTTLTELLEAGQREAQIVLIDRGLFDTLCWMDWFRGRGDLDAADHQAIDRFLLVPRWRRLIDLVFVMTVDPEEALAREFAGQPAKPGRIMNDRTLHEVNRSIAAVRDAHAHEFECVEINTTLADRTSTLGRVVAAVLDGYERFLRPAGQPGPRDVGRAASAAVGAAPPG